VIINYGYKDGSGEYFLAIDSGKCDACGKCVPACPAKALEMTTVFADLEDKPVMGVKEASRKSLHDACSSCDHSGKAPCEIACPTRAIKLTWVRL
jgi:ferredoxin